jgi:hypothetical protein
VRDRLMEFLPLVLVIGVILGVQYWRQDIPFGPPAATRAAPTAVAVAVNADQTPAFVRLAATPGAGCSNSSPRYEAGMLRLKSALGAMMGDPLECERPINANGDTEQRTSTGLAYYRQKANAVVFTNGVQHWALVDRGLVFWTSNSVDPPGDAVLQRS